MTRLVSFDPGLGTFGMSAINSDRRILGTDVVSTSPAKESAKPPKGHGRTAFELSDRSRRVVELFDAADDFVARFEPDAIVAEAGKGLGPGVGANASIYLGASSALVAITARRYRLPMIWVAQGEWRRTIIPKPKSGRHGTYDQSEIVAAVGLDVEALVIANLRAAGKSITLRDHAVDAVGIGRWALDFSTPVRVALRIVKAGSL